MLFRKAHNEAGLVMGKVQRCKFQVSMRNFLWRLDNNIHPIRENLRKNIHLIRHVYLLAALFKVYMI